MAKPQSVKQPNKSTEAAESVETASESPPSVDLNTSATSSPIALPAKKDLARTKKQASAKNGSLLPSAYKLEQLKAAVMAAGSAEKLLLIMHHVEEAGGKVEVAESIEAYRVLKTVLDE